jgi:hypothetical protein
MGKLEKPKAQRERTVPLLAGEDRRGHGGEDIIFFPLPYPKKF